MIEGTPGKPYGGLLAHFNIVEANMKNRRQEVTSSFIFSSRRPLSNLLFFLNMIGLCSARKR
jgi:hypothetical protein